MSISTLATQRDSTWSQWMTDMSALSKPRIAVMVLVAVAVSAYVGSLGYMPWIPLLHAMIGTVLISTSASVMNQWLEIRTDALMNRTSDRPLVSGRITPAQAVAFGMSTLVIGEVYLHFAVNPLTAFFGLVTWVLYVCVYTPLKPITSANTAIGAVSGAMPMLIGWSVARDSVDLQGFSLFMILFLWQFPHFMAIAWLYRRQYKAAGLKMLPVVDPTGRRAGVQAVLGALAVLLVSLVPAIIAPSLGAGIYAGFAFVLGLGQLACAAWFLTARNDLSARWLLRYSLIYLPLVLALLVLIPSL
ncbi:MAG: protoheme IX farnesyltransferase [Pirellulaceae bacterium]|jgi:protoheme IX farnesyltransferase